MGVNVLFTVNSKVAATLTGTAAGVDLAVDQTLDYVSATLLTQIKRNASGRPGPNAPTGDYRRSWTRRKIKNGYSIGTNRPQARRLEMGFYGTDSLGRVYNQAPYPHLDPAIDTVTPGYLQAMDAIATSVAKGDGRVTFGVFK